MFPDARAAPVHKDGSFTLVSSGLKDHLHDKLYNSTRTGADFKKCVQDAFAMVRTEQVTMLDGSQRATMFLPLSVVLLGRPSPFVVLDADATITEKADGTPLGANEGSLVGSTTSHHSSCDSYHDAAASLVVPREPSFVVR